MPTPQIPVGDSTLLSFVSALCVTSIIFLAMLLCRPQPLIARIVFNFILLGALSIAFITTSNFLIMFIIFECLLFVSLNILRLTSKSERVSEAISEMFMWTLLGSVFLILGVIVAMSSTPTVNMQDIRSQSVSPIVGPLLLIGFGVKVPVWPFTS